MTDPRVVQADQMLCARGFSAGSSLAGHSGDILAVRAPMAQVPELRALSAQLKTLGFRYITLELDLEDDHDS